jgi:hypothetical protein
MCLNVLLPCLLTALVRSCEPPKSLRRAPCSHLRGQALTPEYKGDLKDLTDSIITALKHKETLGHVHSGAQATNLPNVLPMSVACNMASIQVSSLLQLIVQSANKGTLSQDSRS